MLLVWALFLVGLGIMVLIEIDATKPKYVYSKESMLNPHRPFAIKAINLIGRVLDKLGYAYPNLRATPLINKAMKEAGITPDKAKVMPLATYLPGLKVITNCLEHESELTMIGRLVAQGMIVQSLRNRFGIDAYHQKHPSAAKLKVKPPLVIMGMARTGTTFLHGLLAKDPSFRAPKLFELVNPLNNEGKSREERIGEHRKELDRFFQLAPNFKAFHHVDSKDPEECCVILQQDMVSQAFSACLNCPSYDWWLMEQDLTVAMSHHRKVLQYYQHAEADFHFDRQWLLKTPQYLIMLPELLQEYPNAKIVWTHRRPKDVMLSLISIITKLTGIVSDNNDPKKFAKQQILTMSRSLSKALIDRKILDEKGFKKNFVDVQFQDICKDPLGVVRTIYDHFGKKLDDNTLERMKVYLASNKRHKHGKPQVHLLHTFGVTDKEIDDLKSFRAYEKRFVRTDQI
ncbi:hypothetical protein AAMO2058_000147600 [Amorphochlora amoebiformis]